MKRLSFLQSLAMLGLFLGLQNMLSSALLLPSILIHGKLELNLTVLAVANAAAFVGTVLLGSLIFRVPWRALVSLGSVPWRVAPAAGIMALGSFVLCSEVDNITRMFLPVPKVLGEMFEQLMNVARHPIGAALALAVVAPLSEELLCRRWVLGSLLARWKPWRAIGLSAVIFGAMHEPVAIHLCDAARLELRLDFLAYRRSLAMHPGPWAQQLPGLVVRVFSTESPGHDGLTQLCA